MTPAASEFWRRVADGTIRLSRAEDAAIWAARKAGADWNTIAEALRKPRERRKMRAARA